MNIAEYESDNLLKLILSFTKKEEYFNDLQHIFHLIYMQLENKKISEIEEYIKASLNLINNDTYIRGVYSVTMSTIQHRNLPEVFICIFKEGLKEYVKNKNKKKIESF